MLARHALLMVPALLLLGCQTRAPATARVTTYSCDDGRTVLAVYSDANSALLTLDGKTQHMHTAISADGARYVNEQWQWWVKGMHDARLAPLKSTETIASARGTSCHTL